MKLQATRRQVLIGALASSVALPAIAQEKPKIRFSAVFSEQDIRANMMKMFAQDIAGQFAFEGYYGGTFSSRAPNSSRSSAAISRWATSPRRTSLNRCPSGRS